MTDVPLTPVSLWTEGHDLLSRILGGPLHPGGARMTRRLLRSLELRPGHRVLEVGCGAGVAASLAPSGTTWVGLDLAYEALRGAVSLLPVQGSGSAAPFRDGVFDRVTSECALCLVGPWEQTLEEVHRLLRPGGRLAFTEFLSEGVSWGESSWADALCLRAPDEGTLRQAFLGEAFRQVEVRDESWSLHQLEEQVQRRVDVLGILDALRQASPASEWAALHRIVAQARQARDEGSLRYVLVSAVRAP